MSFKRLQTPNTQLTGINFKTGNKTKTYTTTRKCKIPVSRPKTLAHHLHQVQSSMFLWVLRNLRPNFSGTNSAKRIIRLEREVRHQVFGSDHEQQSVLISIGRNRGAKRGKSSATCTLRRMDNKNACKSMRDCIWACGRSTPTSSTWITTVWSSVPARQIPQNAAIGNP